MSLACVSSPGVPTMRPRNLSGVGTVLDAGRWSTNSVVMRESWRYSLIFAVYSWSIACLPDAAACRAWANVTVGARKRATVAASSARAAWVSGRIRRDMTTSYLSGGDRAGNTGERGRLRLGTSTRQGRGPLLRG